MRLIHTQSTPLDPRLGVLRDNGGKTLTHALLPGSPAVDAGDTALAKDAQGVPLLLDQRGVDRVFGSGVDIGAFEVNQPFVGLYIDSLNTLRFAMPDRTSWEDDIKNDPNRFGKIIYPNFGDRDGDGILDCWDGLGFTGYYTQANPNSSEQFVPIVVQIAQHSSIDYVNTTITFDYQMAEIILLPDRTKAPSYNDGEIRIWNRDGGQVRWLWNLKDGGNLVETGVDFTLKELGFIDNYGNFVTDTITLYVEGMAWSSQLAESIHVRANYKLLDGRSVDAYDTVRYTILAPDAFGLFIDSDNDGIISFMAMENQTKYTSAKHIPISANSAADLLQPVVFKWSGAIGQGSSMYAVVQFDFPDNYKVFTKENGELASGVMYNVSAFSELDKYGMMMLYVSAVTTDDPANPDNSIRARVSLDVGTTVIGDDKVAVSAVEASSIGLPKVGIVGDIHAVRGTDDIISFNIVRKGDMSQDITVQFQIHWAASNMTINDFKSSPGEQIRLEKFLVDGTTDTYQITIPAGQSKSETIHLRANGSPVPGAFGGQVLLEILEDTNPTGKRYDVVSSAPPGEKIKDRYLNPQVILTVFEQLTLFGNQNFNPALVDPYNGTPGIHRNDVIQGGLADCYFMAALLAFADRHPTWIMSNITSTPSASNYTVKMYNQDGTRQDILIDKTGNILSRGGEMALLSGDYLQWVDNGQTFNAFEIWPQIYEKAWVLMNGGAYHSITSGNVDVDVVWKALTGKNAIQTDCTGKTHAEILQIIDNATAAGKIVCVATKPGADAITMTTPATIFGLAPGAHAYYLTGTSINDYKLINPWPGINVGTPPVFTFQDVNMIDLKNKSGSTDLSQYIACVYVLDPII